MEAINNGRMTAAEVEEQIRQVIAGCLRVEQSQVTPESYLDTDLGGDSLDMVEIAMDIESKFNVWLPEKNILQTAEEVFGPGVLEKDGFLTPAGKQLLARRAAPIEIRELEGEVAVKDLKRYFMRVGTWTHMVYGLLQSTPTACPACGGELASAMGFRLKCRSCNQEIKLRSGDELNREWVKKYYEEEHLPALQQKQASSTLTAA